MIIRDMILAVVIMCSAIMETIVMHSTILAGIIMHDAHIDNDDNA